MQLIKPAQIPTREEMELIRDCILLPMMLTMVENNRQQIEYSNYSMKWLYTKAATVLMDRIHRDLTKARQQLKASHIKVIEEDRADAVIHYRYICRGYEDRFGMMKDVVRSEASIRFGIYIHELFRP